jgi:hypothetical protein
MNESTSRGLYTQSDAITVTRSMDGRDRSSFVSDINVCDDDRSLQAAIFRIMDCGSRQSSACTWTQDGTRMTIDIIKFRVG